MIEYWYCGNSTSDIPKVKNLSDGKFDDTVLYRLLSALATSFESYNPDNTIMIYLKQLWTLWAEDRLY